MANILYVFSEIPLEYKTITKKNKMIKNTILAMLAIGVLTTSCDSDDDSAPKTADLTIDLTGLEALGNDFVYEGWVIVDGSPVSTGTFSSVDFPQSFSVDADQRLCQSRRGEFTDMMKPRGIDDGRRPVDPANAKRAPFLNNDPRSAYDCRPSNVICGQMSAFSIKGKISFAASNYRFWPFADLQYIPKVLTN